MKIGYIDYLNCYPFYFHMFEREPLAGIEVVPAYPSELNMMMREGVLDLSPISAAAYADMQESVLVIPDFCLSSIGYVRSVVLLSKVPIEELTNKTVGLSSASQTSVVLLKILLEKYYGINVRYTGAAPDPDMKNLDAALVIGNEAMHDSASPVQYSYDLGDLWLRKTGYPVVFAIFVVARSAVRKNSELVMRLITSYRKSLDDLRINEAEVVSCASDRYPGINYNVSEYYKLLRFEFTPELRKALQFYYDEAAGLGLLKRVEEIEFL